MPGSLVGRGYNGHHYPSAPRVRKPDVWFFLINFRFVVSIFDYAPLVLTFPVGFLHPALPANAGITGLMIIAPLALLGDYTPIITNKINDTKKTGLIIITPLAFYLL